MYRIVDQQGRTVAITTRREDAEALASTRLDGTHYKIVVDKPNK
jgi:hypothetical protein